MNNPICDENTSPTCPRCKVGMKIGIGINPTRPDWALRAFVDPAEPPIDHTQLTLDKVYKCPKCGHSKDLVNVRP